jgi:ADP-ribose pyrophosphatase
MHENDAIPEGNAEAVFHGRNFVVYRHEVELPGGESEEHEYLWRTDGARIIGFNNEGEVLLTREYRHELGDWDWRVPGGKVDAGETPQQAAKREFREETGFEAGHLHFLWPTTLDSTVRYRRYFFIAKDLKSVGVSREAGEQMSVHWIELDRAAEMALAGEIKEEISALALLRVRNSLDDLKYANALPPAVAAKAR